MEIWSTSVMAGRSRSGICHSDPARFDLLDRLLWRLQEERELLQIASDHDVHRAEALARSVRRDMHKMTAFVRFREVDDGDARGSRAGDAAERRLGDGFCP
ncbi:hypothetical protein BOSE62_40041 [Bosea sp. 62]|nr:hypothetical protein BOSE46_120749 [Bosea sp. 46]CAD5265014.1 hypothetical protein BOSE21B_110985 [Bosea sp. 21B]CAD5275304.1 hypothetical protein BOSE7B_40230 [Bosea sp. 7B]VVT59167.1 hypothetical protein BOS5A_201034 [Bosea sp. EC-HK365B]VXB71997.1 hypothetical protein BOSE29B_120060 [Bosea sp. 29B]VXC11574.1 hypothetical protein BOSE125_170055 [Bosea sp. 125]VXC29939.1 hypothetical protein BOSE62_40041 [Bosea sp. 62]VXC75278.1 hypothetical protein BOSE127_40406 [Bosea sp. 127]